MFFILIKRYNLVKNLKGNNEEEINLINLKNNDKERKKNKEINIHIDEFISNLANMYNITVNLEEIQEANFLVFYNHLLFKEHAFMKKLRL